MLFSPLFVYSGEWKPLWFCEAEGDVTPCKHGGSPRANSHSTLWALPSLQTGRDGLQGYRPRPTVVQVTWGKVVMSHNQATDFYSTENKLLFNNAKAILPYSFIKIEHINWGTLLRTIFKCNFFLCLLRTVFVIFKKRLMIYADPGFKWCQQSNMATVALDTSIVSTIGGSGEIASNII